MKYPFLFLILLTIFFYKTGDISKGIILTVFLVICFVILIFACIKTKNTDSFKKSGQYNNTTRSDNYYDDNYWWNNNTNKKESFFDKYSGHYDSSHFNDEYNYDWDDMDAAYDEYRDEYSSREDFFDDNDID